MCSLQILLNVELPVAAWTSENTRVCLHSERNALNEIQLASFNLYLFVCILFNLSAEQMNYGVRRGAAHF